LGALFDRRWALTVSTLEVDAFAIHFRVEKTIKPEPNKVLLEVWNLNDEHRAALQELAPGKRVGKKAGRKGKTSPNLTGSVPVRLEAGYAEDGTDQIFLGDLRTVDSELSGPDWITAVTSGDGERAFRTARIKQAFGPRTPVRTALSAAVKSLGLGTGNLASVLASLQLQGNATVYTRGVVLTGSAARVLSDICKSANLEWSIQDGVVQFVDLNKALAQRAISLTSSTGLIGSPNVDGNGVLKAKTLMIPGLSCGRLVVVDSRQIQGQFRVEKIITEGASHGPDWGHEIEAKRY
jgi:hypothetical protein